MGIKKYYFEVKVLVVVVYVKKKNVNVKYLTKWGKKSIVGVLVRSQEETSKKV